MSGDPLEQRLEALLRGPDLDLAARPDASGVLQRRVRRVKRRRQVVQTAVPAVLAVAAMVAGFTLLPQDEPDAGPAPGILTSSGIGGLELGMSVSEAREAGLIGAQQEEVANTCQRYAGTGLVEEVSVRGGLIVRIDAGPFADNTEGIAIGDTYADLQQAYGEGVSSLGSPPSVRIPLDDPGGTRYEFDLDAPEPRDVRPETRLLSMSLSSTTQVCA